ncbi:uncharacterized protein A4U43_C04F24420 [Asparagus officinalis]|uniref:Uncharacterized protein n=1 Tax=Asparagus officinalis TaxID=4686 RepID=A0A5P1F556_ASPOF|nr:uncharacterized protein A4U43_C04F24420 [Asparagus officinalis]
MIQASTPTSLWYPGKKFEGFATSQLSTRAREIAKSREEMLGLLQDLPETEHELSFTDLVEKSEPAVCEETSSCGEKEKKRAAAGVKERKKLRRNSSRAERIPAGQQRQRLLAEGFVGRCSLTRSLTVSSRAGRGTTTGAPKIVAECPKREKEPVMVGCLSGLWEKSKGKSKKKVAERKGREAHDYYF